MAYTRRLDNVININLRLATDWDERKGGLGVDGEG